MLDDYLCREIKLIDLPLEFNRFKSGKCYTYSKILFIHLNIFLRYLFSVFEFLQSYFLQSQSNLLIFLFVLLLHSDVLYYNFC